MADITTKEAPAEVGELDAARSILAQFDAARPVFGVPTDEDAAFVRDSVEAIRDRYGDLPVRANRYAMRAAIDAGVISAETA